MMGLNIGNDWQNIMKLFMDSVLNLKEKGDTFHTVV